MIKKLQALKAKKGFTLVELIVVIAIIGVLAAILVPTMLNQVTSSRVTSANSTAKSLLTTINTFITEMDTKGYGTQKATGTDANTPQATITISVDNAGVYTISDDVSLGCWSSAAQSLSPTMSGITNNTVYGYLEEKLKSDFSFSKNVCVIAYLNNGKCTAVVYYADGDTMPGTPTAGTDYPSYQNFVDANTTFAWGSNDGVTSAGAVLGTSPQLTTALE